MTLKQHVYDSIVWFGVAFISWCLFAVTFPVFDLMVGLLVLAVLAICAIFLYYTLQKRSFEVGLIMMVFLVSHSVVTGRYLKHFRTELPEIALVILVAFALFYLYWALFRVNGQEESNRHLAWMPSGVVTGGIFFLGVDIELPGGGNLNYLALVLILLDFWVKSLLYQPTVGVEHTGGAAGDV